MYGGGGRNRTGVHGFAGRCITTLPPRRVCCREKKNGKTKSRFRRNSKFASDPEITSLSRKLERERRLELPTSTLARLRSTN